MTWTLQIFEKSLCLNTFLFFVCFSPITFPLLGAGKVKTASANTWSSRGRKIKGKQRELNHKLWSRAAAGFHPFLLLSQPGSYACWLPDSHHLGGDCRGAYPDPGNVSPGGQLPCVSPRASFPFLHSRSLEPERPLVNEYLIL